MFIPQPAAHPVHQHEDGALALWRRAQVQHQAGRGHRRSCGGQVPPHRRLALHQLIPARGVDNGGRMPVCTSAVVLVVGLCHHNIVLVN